MAIPEGTDQTIDNKTMSLSTFANVQIPWTGEDMKHMDNGAGFQYAYSMQILQAMRAIVNKIELDLGAAIDLGAGMGYGTAGTLAGGSATLAQVQGQALSAGAILTESGVPTPQRAAIVDPASRVGIISPFTTNVFDNRVVSDIFDKTAFASKTFGFDWAEDANVQQFTPMAVYANCK